MTAMHLIEILLPLKDPDGNDLPGEFYDRLAQQLSERFGGATGFFRSPAEGRWQSGDSTEHDDIIVLATFCRASCLFLQLRFSVRERPTGTSLP